MPGPDTLRSLQRSVSHDAHDSVAMPMETGKDETVAGCRTGALRRVYEAGHLHRYNAKAAVVRPPTFATRLIIFVKSCLYELLPAFLSVIAMLLLERSHMYAINRAITPFSKKVISSPFWWITQVLWYPAVYGTMCVYLLTDNNVDSVEVYFGCFFIVLRAVMVSTKCIRKHARSVPRCHSPRKHCAQSVHIARGFACESVEIPVQSPIRSRTFPSHSCIHTAIASLMCPAVTWALMCMWWMGIRVRITIVLRNGAQPSELARPSSEDACCFG